MARRGSILCGLWACAALAGDSVGAATPLHPIHGEEVIKVLQSVTRVRLSALPTPSAEPGRLSLTISSLRLLGRYLVALSCNCWITFFANPASTETLCCPPR